MEHREEEVPESEPAPPTSTLPPQEERDLEAPLLPGEEGTQNVPSNAQNDTLLYVCAILSIVTAIGGLLCLVVNLISLLRSIDYRGFNYRVSVCPLTSFHFLPWICY